MSDVARREETGDDRRLIAELIYTPERPWLGNLMLRPGTRGYEIDIRGTPGVEEERLIPIDELVVGVSDNTFHLRWPNRNAYVEVSEAHMLNPKTAPAIGAFLALMRHAGRPVMTGFSWGAARELPRLPRIQSGRVVLSPATWRPVFAGADLQTGDSFAAALSRWAEEWSVPRHVFAAEADQRLLIDLDDRAQVDLLHRLIAASKDEAPVVLQEALPGLESAWLPGPGGRYLVELAVPVAARARRLESLRADRQRRRPPAGIAPPPPRAVRLRAPGSDWLYVKLYVGGVLAERLIGSDLRRFARAVLAEGLADDWFFVRYRDPRAHLRVRFHGEPATLTRELAPRLYGWVAGLIDDGACESLAIDTYAREIERYGGEAGIGAAEKVFGVDSRLAAELIGLDLSSAISLTRELLCVLTLNLLLAGLGLDEPERQRWCSATVGSRHEAAADWRVHKNLLRSLLADPGAACGAIGAEALAQLLDHYLEDLRPHAQTLTGLLGDGDGHWPERASVIGSFAHMHCNRLLGADRAAERRAMGLLQRTLDSLRRAPAR